MNRQLVPFGGQCSLPVGDTIGKIALADALERAIRSEIATYALMVDAKDDTAATFYRHHGFIPLPDTPLTLFLPLATAQASQKRGDETH